MENYKTVMYLLEKNDYMASIDLKDAFNLISVDKESRKYLRFQFKRNLYEFCCIPFGYNEAPFIFTKLLKPVASTLKSLGIKSVFYLDDILIICKNDNDCQKSIRKQKIY